MKDTKPDRGRAHDELVLEARKRLERQAAKLAIVIGAHDAATSFVGIGMAMLASTYGHERAAAFMSGCADELQNDDGEPIEGSA